MPLARLQPPEAAADLVDARKTAHEHPLHLEFWRGDQKSGRLGCAFDRDGKGLELRLRAGCRHEQRGFHLQKIPLVKPRPQFPEHLLPGTQQGHAAWSVPQASPAERICTQVSGRSGVRICQQKSPLPPFAGRSRFPELVKRKQRSRRRGRRLWRRVLADLILDEQQQFRRVGVQHLQHTSENGGF